MINLILSILLAALMLLVIFGLKIVHFWYGMMIASGVLALWSILYAREDRKKLFEFKSWHIIWGLFSAGILYFIFYFGNYFSNLIFDFASGQINSVYDFKLGQNGLAIGLFMFFWIAPAEEIFWRGMIQRKLNSKIGDFYGWIIAAVLYSLAHIWSANFMLIMAALVCGLFWGWIYRKTGSLWPGIISHAVWDIAIFFIFPFI
jgi:membrane protease YdiL (CAAX protease family)